MEKIEKKKNAGGRPLHEGWQLYHFEKVEGEKGKSVAKCMKCQNTIKNTTLSRLLGHRKRCGSLPSFTISSLSSPIVSAQHPAQVQVSQEAPVISKIEISEYNQESTRGPEILWSQESEDNYVEETVNQDVVLNEDIQRHRKSNDPARRKSDSKSMDVALSSFLIGCNLTFDVVDSKHFKAFVNSLNPDYKIPTSAELIAKVLNQLKGSEEKPRGRKRQYYSSDSD